MWFTVGSILGVLLVVLLALRFRSRFYAIYAGVLLSLVFLFAASTRAGVPALEPVIGYLFAAACAHSAALIWARPRPLAFRLLVTWPALYFMAGALLSLPWAVAQAVGHPLPWPLVPYVIALFGVVESIRTKRSVVDLALDGRDVGPDVRRLGLGSERVPRPLRLVQITDPHLGPFMSIRRLRRICERAVAQEPDLILLTGDFLTMESQRDPSILSEALAPLAKLPGRVYACRGNHDLEAPETVAEALDRVGARLLIDEEAVVDTPAGGVQLLGLDFAFRRRAEKMKRVFANHPRRAGYLRLVLLHDPGAFSRIDPGEADLVLSGHTHGGHVGLLRFGLPWTAVSLFSSIPDHGFFGRGSDRLYVHRGTGHYGFPLRVGVPPEESLVRVHRATC